EPARRVLEVLRALERHPGRTPARAHAGPGLVARADGGRALLVLVHLRRVRLDRGHAASSAVSCEATISWYVSQWSSRSSCRPRPTITPSSSTMIWSAW